MVDVCVQCLCISETDCGVCTLLSAGEEEEREKRMGKNRTVYAKISFIPLFACCSMTMSSAALLSASRSALARPSARRSSLTTVAAGTPGPGKDLASDLRVRGRNFMAVSFGESNASRRSISSRSRPPLKKGPAGILSPSPPSWNHAQRVRKDIKAQPGGLCEGRRPGRRTTQKKRGSYPICFFFYLALFFFGPTRPPLPRSPAPAARSPSLSPPLPSFLHATQRHDALSAGVGALAVTTYCVVKGQDPATALSITAAATVAAMVAEEVLFSGGRRP